MFQDELTERCPRCERKFLVSEFNEFDLEIILKLHPADFFEFYPPRYVNNIYFDFYGYENYFDNLAGAPDRCKFRIRWYHNLFGKIEKPALELKIKKGLVGDKKLFVLNPFVLDENIKLPDFYDFFVDANIPKLIFEDLKAMQPTLLNRYKRRYFQSRDKKYRVTIDSNLIYYKISRSNNSFSQRLKDINHVILELKYEIDNDDLVSCITNFFPFRMTKSSKYIIGVENV